MLVDISISKEALSKFKNGDKQYAKLEFTNVMTISNNSASPTLTNQHIAFNGLSIELLSAISNVFELGTLCAGEVKIELLRDSVTGYYFDASIVKISIGVKLDNGSIEYVPFGVYNIDEVKNNKNTVRLSGLDNTIKFEKMCNGASTPEGDVTNIFNVGDTIAQAIAKICDYCGVGYYIEELNTLPNHAYQIEQLPTGIEQIKCRQVLMQLIALTGCCGRMDGQGKLRITPYEFTDETISLGDRYESEIDESSVVLTGVRVINASGDSHLAGKDGYVLEIMQNDFILTGVADLAKNIWTFLQEENNIEYLPYLATTVSLPHLRPLQRIWVADTQGEYRGSIITNYLFRLNNSTKIQAKGVSVRRKNYGKPSAFSRSQSRIIAKSEDLIDDVTNKRVASLRKFNETLINALGVYSTEIINDGVIKWYFHDKKLLSESNNIFTITSAGIGWTDEGWNNGSPNWKYGVEATGGAFIKKLVSGGIVVSQANKDYDVTITPEEFSINYKNASVTNINRGLMHIPRLRIGGYIDLGALRIASSAFGIDLICKD